MATILARSAVRLPGVTMTGRTEVHGPTNPRPQEWAG